MQSILAVDPGSKNFGYAIVQWRDDGKYRVTESGMVKNTVRDLKGNIDDPINAFRAEVEGIIVQHDITVMVAERFVSRGLLGSQSEYVNIMLGTCFQIPQIQNRQLIIPATWKNAFKKFYSLDDFYKERPRGTTKHEIDSSLIGIYHVNKNIFGSVPYDGFESVKRRKRIMHQIVNGIQKKGVSR